MAVMTLLLSMNLDNLTTTLTMILFMQKMLPNRKQRAVFGVVIVLSANIGGALTVIGAPNGLLLWNLGAVTPSHFSAWMALPCLAAWAVPTYLISRSLPERVDLERYSMPYRGDDTNLTVWQRIIMFFFAIGGLWFIPTFHNITRLSPFVGALCVLSLLWITNEAFNRNLSGSGQIVKRYAPQTQLYTMLQTMLFVMGIMLIMGILVESGAGLWVGEQCKNALGDVWILAIAPLMAGLSSLVLDSFATATAFFSLYNIQGVDELAQNGIYWIAIAYATAIGETILGIGSLSGLALFSSKTTSLKWYVCHFTPKVIVGALLGLAILIAEALYF